MSYWKSVLDEVLNKNDPNYKFYYTNLGERFQAKIEIRQCREPRRSYYIGHHFENKYFTQREMECLYHLLRGKTVVATAEILGLSDRTIEFYVKNMKAKMGCQTKTELIELVKKSEICHYFDLKGDDFQ